jgi:hypothetical protein
MFSDDAADHLYNKWMIRAGNDDSQQGRQGMMLGLLHRKT